LDLLRTLQAEAQEAKASKKILIMLLSDELEEREANVRAQISSDASTIKASLQAKRSLSDIAKQQENLKTFVSLMLLASDI